MGASSLAAIDEMEEEEGGGGNYAALWPLAC
jgi:hypothetical protein